VGVSTDKRFQKVQQTLVGLLGSWKLVQIHKTGLLLVYPTARLRINTTAIVL
jgi:hypothetical protein